MSEQLLLSFGAEIAKHRLDKMILESIEAYKSAHFLGNQSTDGFLDWFRVQVQMKSNNNQGFFEAIATFSKQMLNKTVLKTFESYLPEYQEKGAIYGDAPEGFYTWLKEEIELEGARQTIRRIEVKRKNHKNKLDQNRSGTALIQ